MVRIGIVGAGAIGGWLGAQLATVPGTQVSAFARGTTLAALQADGLQLLRNDASGTPQTLRTAVRASHNAAELGVQDVLILSVKGPAVPSVVSQIAPMIGPQTVVLSAMNGVPWWFLQDFGGTLANQRLQSVDATGAIAQHIPAQHIVGCVVHASCSTPAPGIVQHHFGNGLIVGEPSGAKTPRGQELLALLQRAGFQATLSEQIQRDIWFKLWGNMTINPISAITGATTDKILDDDLVRGFISQVMLEAKAIGAGLGIAIDQQPDDRHQMTRKLGSFKTSMLQDVQNNKPVELDALVGAVQELGRMTLVPTPYTDALLGLARLHARVRGLY